MQAHLASQVQGPRDPGLSSFPVPLLSSSSASYMLCSSPLPPKSLPCCVTQKSLFSLAELQCKFMHTMSACLCPLLNPVP